MGGVVDFVWQRDVCLLKVKQAGTPSFLNATSLCPFEDLHDSVILHIVHVQLTFYFFREKKTT